MSATALQTRRLITFEVWIVAVEGEAFQSVGLVGLGSEEFS